MKNKSTPLLEVSELSVSFKMYNKLVQQKELKVITDLEIMIYAGEILAVVGSSGSGKSLLAHAIMGLLPNNANVNGNLFFKGMPMNTKSQKKLRGTEIALIPQSVTYLDPLMQIGKQTRGATDSIVKVKRQRNIFKRLNLMPQTEKLYPFQLSGGMARRVLFSTAIISDAELVIADEPTPGMHISQAMEALSILRELADAGKGILLITHDIDLAIHFADKIAVLYAGTTVEVAPAANFIIGSEALKHPYSKALWGALPQNGFKPIDGFQPYVGSQPTGCKFAPRCPEKTSKCEVINPAMRVLGNGMVRCVHAT